MAKLLVVDDSSLSRRILRRILEEGGHKVAEAADGMIALEQYAMDKPDMVLLDVTMTEMNGLEVLRQLRALDANARVVMATADVQSSTRTLAEGGGAIGFVLKPFSSETILHAVNAALAGQGAIDETH
jgi:two-component system, chemotaxis family, chemotaxis protein CheY